MCSVRIFSCIYLKISEIFCRKSAPKVPPVESIELTAISSPEESAYEIKPPFPLRIKIPSD